MAASPPAQVSYITPASSVAVQKAANQILDLIEREKAVAVQQKDAAIHHLAAANQALEDCKNKQAEAAARHANELKSLSDELQRAKDSKQDLQSTVDALRQERDQLRTEFNTSVTLTQEAIEKMGIHKVSPGRYSFTPPWVDLFQELGLSAERPWGPDQLLSVIITTAERLRHFRHLQPHRVVHDPYALQAELARARAYTASLEGEFARYNSHPPPPPPPLPLHPPYPPQPAPQSYTGPPAPQPPQTHPTN